MRENTPPRWQVPTEPTVDLERGEDLLCFLRHGIRRGEVHLIPNFPPKRRRAVAVCQRNNSQSKRSLHHSPFFSLTLRLPSCTARQQLREQFFQTKQQFFRPTCQSSLSSSEPFFQSVGRPPDTGGTPIGAAVHHCGRPIGATGHREA